VGKQGTTRRKTARRATRRSAQSSKAATRRRHRLIILGVVVVGSAIVRSWFLQGYTIPSRSMEDTLLLGDSVLVEKVSAHTVEPGDVVVFESPEDPDRTFIKRCIAVAGQRVEIRSKVVYVDGERLPDPRYSKYLDARILAANRGQRDNLAARTVPAGQLFLMGDNRDNSRDSRHWGFLSVEAVVGRAIMIYFSAREEDEESGFAARLASLPGRLRWQRIGASVQ
jgi:signal peptidase I